MRLTLAFNAIVTRSRRRHGRAVKLRPVVSYEADLYVEVDYTPDTAGRFCGPPERCYPDEPADLNVLEARDAATGRTADWTPSREQMRELVTLAGDAFEDEVGDAAIDAYERGR